MITEERVPLVDLRTAPGVWTIGGKASGLQRLAARGLPVPAGRVIPTEAGEDDIDRLSAEIAAEWTGPLAVRSSGVGEDSATSSFAGQFDTVLGVEPTASAIAQAVRQVRASAEALRVQAYAPGAPVEMAVLIMPMVEATAAGIAFTRNPVTGENVVVIEAVIGIADALASGEQRGERWAVGNRARRLSDDLGVLDPEHAVAVADLARAVEDLEGIAQDIEWAIEGDRVQLLQARPITTLDGVEPVPMDDAIPPGPWEWDSAHNRSPVTPLLGDVFPEGMLRGSRLLASEYGLPIDHLRIRTINGYLYVQVVPTAAKPGAPLPPAPVFRLLFKVIPALRRHEKTAERAFADRTYEQWHLRWTNEGRPLVEATLSDWFDLDVTAISNAELARCFSDAVELLRDTFAWNMVTDPAYLIPLVDLDSFVSEHLGAGLETTLRLVAGSSPSEYHSSITELAGELTPEVRALIEGGGSDLLARIAAVNSSFATAYRRHQREHGFTILGFDIDQPTMSEDPAAELRRIVALPQSHRDPNDDAAALRSELASTLNAEMEREFDARVSEARRTYWIREEGNAVFFRTIGALRRFMLESGRRMVLAGHAAHADDAAFLVAAETVAWLEEGTDFSGVIRTRRGQRLWAAERTPPATYGPVSPPPGPELLPPNVGRVMEVFNFILAHDQRPADLAPGSDGVGASAGVYVGPVRIVFEPSEFSKVRPGDVLVCPLTTSSWEVVFPNIGALVSEGGGMLSHPAIVAREYGLPAVVSCEGATTRFYDGQVVTVNGTLGTVTPME